MVDIGSYLGRWSCNIATNTHWRKAGGAAQRLKRQQNQFLLCTKPTAEHITHRIKSFHFTHPISNRPNTLPLKKNRWSHSVTLKVFQNNDSLRARKCGLTIRDALLEKNGIMWEKFPSGKPLVQYTVEKSQWCNVAQLEHLGRSIHPFDATHILPSQPVQGPTSQIPPKLILFQDLWFATKFHKEISLNLDAIT